MANTKITTNVIADDAITGAKIADDAINSEHYTDGSIDTAHIADDQVTLAKMAGIARGKIIYGDSSGNPAVLAVGSNGQVLKSDGTDISWGTDSSNDRDGAAVFNESGAAVDFRVESNGLANALVVNGGDDAVLIGTAVSDATAGITPIFQVEGTSKATSAVSLSRNSDDAYGPHLVLNKTRGTSVNSDTVVQSGDYLGVIAFGGADGTDRHSQGAAIHAMVDGTPGGDDLPGRLMFLTTANGASGVSERMRIDSSGKVGIGTTSPNAAEFSATPNGVLEVEGTKPVVYLSETDTTDAHGWLGVSSGVTYLGSTGGGLQIRTGTDSASTKVTVDTSGKVGIGTTSPSTTLHTKGGSASSFIRIDNSADGHDTGFEIYQNGSRKWELHSDDSNSDALSIRNNAGTEKFSFAQDGTFTAGNKAGKVAFRAYLGSSLAVSAGTHTFAGSSQLTQEFDVGSCFNPSTGKFTAPQAGTYHFSATITMGADTAAVEYLSAEIVATPSGGSATRYICGGWNSKPTGDNAYASSGGSVTIQLAANAEVTLGYETSDGITLQGGIGHCSFSGFLVA